MTTEEKIIEMVADHFDVSIDEMKVITRCRTIVEARQIVFYLCRKTLPLTLKKIGVLLHKGHATVVHSISAVEKRMDVYPLERQVIIKFLQQINECKEFDKAVKCEEVFQENDFYLN